MSHKHLNILRVDIPDVVVNVGVLPFETADALRKLRNESDGSHLYRRGKLDSRDVIFIVRLDGQECQSTPERCDLPIRKNLGLACSLIKERLIAGFSTDKNRRILDAQPLKILSSDANHDLLSRAAGNASVPSWLIARLAHTIDARIFEFDGQEAFVGVVIDQHTYRRIERPCSVWLEEGHDITGLYVSERVPWNDNRLHPRSRLMGRVERIEGATLHLSDHREGESQVNAGLVEIDPDHAGFEHALAIAFGGDSRSVDRALFELQSSIQSGRLKFAELSRVQDRLVRKPLALLPNLQITINNHLDDRTQGFPVVRSAPQALFIFDRTFNSPAATDARRGLREHGPYSQVGFTPLRPRFCVVCQGARKGEVEQFLRKHFEGNQEATRTSHFPQGLTRLYRLHDKDVRFFISENGTAAACRKAAQQALAAVTADAERWHLAFVQVDDNNPLQVGDANPYLAAKSTFLAQQVPTQEFQTATIRKQGIGLDFTLANIALASYSKLGGTPWQLAVDKALAHELVVGLGSASIGEARLGARQRLVGITTMFTNEGKYLLGTMSNAVPYDDYGTAVVEMLRSSLERARRDMNWQPGDEVRLVVHSFKPIKDTEAEAVKQVASQLSEYSVDFAFVHVAQDHDMMLFDTENQGVPARQGPGMKGEFAPARGTYMKLNNRDALLSLTGPEELNRPQQGLPKPLLLHLHRLSTFNDIDYLARQVYTFSCHSWRTFDKSGLPVTILYSDLIARLLGRLSTVSHFSIDSIPGRMNQLRWFL